MGLMTGFETKIRHFLRKADFTPRWWGIFFNPFYLASRDIARGVKHFAPHLKGKVLDFGAGTQPYKALLSSCSAYTALEYDTKENKNSKDADILYDGISIPVPDETFDSIISTEVLEHVPNPEEIAQEWYRVLRADGKLLLTTPFMWPEHGGPYDFQRYTSFGLKRLLNIAGFEVIEQKRLLIGSRALFQLFIAWLFDCLSGHKILRRLLVPLVVMPLSLLAELLSLIPCKESRTYYNNLIFARKIKL